MRSLLALLGLLVAVHLAISIFINGMADYRAQALVIVAVSAAAYGLAFLIARRIRRVRPKRYGIPYPSTVAVAPALSVSRTLVIVALYVLVAAEVLILFPRAGRSVLTVEIGYYLALVAASVALALWANASVTVPVMLAILTNVVLAVVSAAVFMRDPDAEFAYGPELPIFAVMEYLWRSALLPFDAAVTAGAWTIARACGPMSNTALQPTAGPSQSLGTGSIIRPTGS